MIPLVPSRVCISGTIFEQVVRPRLSEQSDSIRMQLIRMGAGCLIVPPFVSLESKQAGYDSKTALNIASRFRGLSELAISDDQESSIASAISSAETLGFMANALKVMLPLDTRNYKTIGNKFASICEELKNDPNEAGTLKRFQDLKQIYCIITVIYLYLSLLLSHESIRGFSRSKVINWKDLIEFEIAPVMTSAEASSLFPKEF